MPTPKPYERQDVFVQRCVPELIDKEGYDKAQATAICYQIYNKKPI